MISEKRRPLVFLAVGVINTGLDFVFYTLLTSVFFTKPQVHMLVIGALSGTFALVCALITHATITWRGHHTTKKTILRFFVLTGFGMWVIRPILLAIFIQFTPLYRFAKYILDAFHVHMNEAFIGNSVAFCLMVVVMLLYNYFVYNRYVFKSPAPQKQL